MFFVFLASNYLYISVKHYRIEICICTCQFLVTQKLWIFSDAFWVVKLLRNCWFMWLDNILIWKQPRLDLILKGFQKCCTFSSWQEIGHNCSELCKIVDQNSNKVLIGESLVFTCPRNVFYVLYKTLFFILSCTECILLSKTLLEL